MYNWHNIHYYKDNIIIVEHNYSLVDLHSSKKYNLVCLIFLSWLEHVSRIAICGRSNRGRRNGRKVQNPFE